MVRSTIQQCVNSERYVIYNLKHDQVLSTPWIDNTLLLIISSEKVYDGVDQAFLKYFLQGGLLMSFGSTFDELITDKVCNILICRKLLDVGGPIFPILLLRISNTYIFWPCFWQSCKTIIFISITICSYLKTYMCIFYKSGKFFFWLWHVADIDN